MTINYDKIQAAVKALGDVADNDLFLEGFLSAFNFPKATYNRLKVGMKSGTNSGIRIPGNGGLYFLPSAAASLNSEFNILKKNNDLSKIREAFIVIVNDTEIVAFERVTGDILETNKKDLYRYIEFFFSLLGIKPEVAPDEMKSADKKAAERFAGLYTELTLRNPLNTDIVSEFLCRLLFCCFADSIGVLSKSALRTVVTNYTDVSGSDLGTFFGNLFEALSSKSRNNLPGYFSCVKFTDARLFSDSLPPLVFSRKARDIVLNLMGLNWSDISPDILGSLIQSIVCEEAGFLTKNYTTTANIQKVIGPLFMDELYSSFEQLKLNHEGCKTLLKRVCAISVLDPSSGAGNFLLVAYKELNKLAHKIKNEICIHDQSAVVNHSEQCVTWKNFYGIDEDTFSCNIARLGFLFVVCQESSKDADIEQVFSQTVDVLFGGNIFTGNPTRVDWETVCKGNKETYIIGNPPYIGARKQTPSQKADLSHIFREYTGVSNLDYAACWFMLATRYICDHGGGFAFVTTNSLTQGEQVPLLWPKLLEKGVYIRFAHTSFKWKNDARNRTAVTVVIIGVCTNNDNRKRELYTTTTLFEPKSISPYLVPGNAIVNSRRLPISNLPKMLKGNMPYDDGNLLLNKNEMAEIISNEQDAKRFIRKIVGSKEFIRGIDRWCLWIADTDFNDAIKIPSIKKRVEKVRISRLRNKDSSAKRLAERPHQFREMRETYSQSLVVPAVSSENYLYIPIGFVGRNTVVNNLVSIIYDCEPWIFGVVSSQMHNVWVKTVCGKHEERPRYSLELGYNTFPFPDITHEQKTIIYKCVLGIIREREKFAPKPLAQLYKVGHMPLELLEAHSLLDKFIESCYRQTPFVSDQDRLECLFELYQNLGG